MVKDKTANEYVKEVQTPSDKSGYSKKMPFEYDMYYIEYLNYISIDEIIHVNIF